LTDGSNSEKNFFKCYGFIPVTQHHVRSRPILFACPYIFCSLAKKAESLNLSIKKLIIYLNFTGIGLNLSLIPVQFHIRIPVMIKGSSILAQSGYGSR
jgi:hypothetical protein